jgi:hypothetical protein
MPEKPRKKTRRQLLEEAFRVRAGAIGLLTCCRCTYPLKQHETATFHAADCPAHAVTLSAMATGDAYHLAWTKSGKP